MNFRIKTTEANQQLIRDFTVKLRLPAENIIARIAFAFSLAQHRKFKANNNDSKGKEYADDVLFGRQKPYYLSLICQHYQINKHDPSIPKYVKFHVDDGLEMMSKFFESNQNHTVYDFLIEAIDRGIEGVEHADSGYLAVDNNNRIISEKGFFNGMLNLAAGKSLDDEDIVFQPNNVGKYNNSHVAIAGTTGSGKTQFILELLAQISEQSGGQTNFCYLDFKGLNPEDEKKLGKFFTATKTDFINAPHKPFPINPFSFIDNVNEKNKILGINKFTDIVVDYSNAGANQKQYLRDAVKAVFAKRKTGTYPTLAELHDELMATMDKSKNRVVGVVEGLSQFEMFTDETNKDFLNRNHYFSLSADLPKDVRFTSIFLIINYIFNTFMSMPDTPVENEARAMRYFLVVDEAQVIFRDSKSKLILQYILEQIRSKGVGVILLAQNIEEFQQPSFNFTSLCEIAFLLKINDIRNTKMIARFLGLSDREIPLVARSLEKMEPGMGVSNLKEFKRGELLKINQYFRR